MSVSTALSLQERAHELARQDFEHIVDRLDSKEACSMTHSYDHFDLHEITKKWISLDDMARIIGCKLKTGTGKGAIQLWKERKIDELIKYCAQDVEVTEEVYLKHKQLRGDSK